LEKKAVAIKYTIRKDSVPEVIAKGKGFIAEKIIEIAKENNIEIIENRELVETLININIGEEIPYEVYQVVAEILAFIYKVTHQEIPLT
jgi:flagellar biosynthesis protein